MDLKRKIKTLIKHAQIHNSGENRSEVSEMQFILH